MHSHTHTHTYLLFTIRCQRSTLQHSPRATKECMQNQARLIFFFVAISSAHACCKRRDAEFRYVFAIYIYPSPIENIYEIVKPNIRQNLLSQIPNETRNASPTLNSDRFNLWANAAP